MTASVELIITKPIDVDHVQQVLSAPVAQKQIQEKLRSFSFNED